jgi:hypothetical protein
MNNKKMRVYDQANYESTDGYFHENLNAKFHTNLVSSISSYDASNRAAFYTPERFMAIPEFDHQFGPIPNINKFPPKPTETNTNRVNYPYGYDNFIRSYERDAPESVPKNSLHGNGSSLHMLSSEDAHMFFGQGFHQPYVSIFIMFSVSFLR